MVMGEARRDLGFLQRLWWFVSLTLGDLVGVGVVPNAARTLLWGLWYWINLYWSCLY